MTNSKTIFGTIQVAGKSYRYTMTPVCKKGLDLTHFVCAGAGIDQNFLSSDLVSLFRELPEIIIEEQAFQMQEKTRLTLRLSKEQKKEITKRAEHEGKNMTDYVLAKVLA